MLSWGNGYWIREVIEWGNSNDQLIINESLISVRLGAVKLSFRYRVAIMVKQIIVWLAALPTDLFRHRSLVSRLQIHNNYRVIDLLKYYTLGGHVTIGKCEVFKQINIKKRNLVSGSMLMFSCWFFERRIRQQKFPDCHLQLSVSLILPISEGSRRHDIDAY